MTVMQSKIQFIARSLSEYSSALARMIVMKSKIQFVAEVSSNHHQNIERCLSFIDAAADIGCQAVKFQLFKIDRMFAPEILAESEDHRKRIRLELPVEFLPILHSRCVQRGIQFACTPFYLEAVEQLQPYVSFYKIASYDLLRSDLLSKCARTGKPVVLSTGMATMDEIICAINILRANGAINMTVLHCVSGYPTPPTDCNLSAIQNIRSKINIPVGWSDHTRRPEVIRRAAMVWGASMIEFHLDLDGKGEEFGLGHCWLPSEISSIISECNEHLMDGNGEKAPTQSEIDDRAWRADPSDGLRPLLKTRAAWKAGNKKIKVKIFKK